MSSVAQIERIGNRLLVRAPAKINLSLLIAGKRPDGYHEIKTVMAKVDWFDELLFEEGTKEGIELVCGGKYEIPEGKDNLVWKAAELFSKKTGISRKIKIKLTKNIPAGSGLGSGSSDAAATLTGCNEFYKAGIAKNEIAEMAAELGSDTAFFVNGPLALCEGRGEKISEIDKKFEFSAILILPNVNTSTKRVYENYRHEEELFGRLNEQLMGFIVENRVDLISEMCANMLAKSCFALHPEIASLKNKIEQLGIAPLCLSGSGSTLFHIMKDRDGNNRSALPAYNKWNWM